VQAGSKGRPLFDLFRPHISGTPVRTTRTLASRVTNLLYKGVRARRCLRHLSPCVQASEARVRTSAFWAAAIANLGVEVPAAPPRPVVTVVTKKGRRAIENAAEIADALRQRFMGVDVQLLDGNSLNTISVKARVSPSTDTQYMVP
jgi:hypothetical protein